MKKALPMAFAGADRRRRDLESSITYSQMEIYGKLGNDSFQTWPGIFCGEGRVGVLKERG